MSADINVEIHPILVTKAQELTRQYEGALLEPRVVPLLEYALANLVDEHIRRGLHVIVVKVEDT